MLMDAEIALSPYSFLTILLFPFKKVLASASSWAKRPANKRLLKVSPSLAPPGLSWSHSIPEPVLESPSSTSSIPYVADPRTTYILLRVKHDPTSPKKMQLPQLSNAIETTLNQFLNEGTGLEWTFWETEHLRELEAVVVFISGGGVYFLPRVSLVEEKS
jgi:hypothetical protein